MSWAIEDVSPPKTFEEGSIAGDGVGDLRNPNFPRKVAPDESWSGTIDIVNTGDEIHTFRVRRDAEVRAGFDLGPGDTKTVDFSGTGPETFTIYLERMVARGIWEKYKYHIVAGSAILAMAGLAVARRG